MSQQSVWHVVILTHGTIPLEEMEIPQGLLKHLPEGATVLARPWEPFAATITAGQVGPSLAIAWRRLLEAAPMLAPDPRPDGLVAPAPPLLLGRGVA